MRRIAALIFAALLPLSATAQTPARPLTPPEVVLDDMLWVARPLVVFAASPQDPSFQRQMQLLSSDPASLTERQIAIIVDTDADSELRRRFRPNGFAILLLDTNGRVLLTRPTPRTVREITAAVDKSPLRRQELQDRRFQEGDLTDGGSGG